MCITQYRANCCKVPFVSQGPKYDSNVKCPNFDNWTEILMHFTDKEEMHLTNICLRDFAKTKTLDGELSSDFEWGRAIWPPAFWWLR